MIDDYYGNLDKFNGHTMLFDAPWNRDVINHQRVHNWHETYITIKELEFKLRGKMDSPDYNTMTDEEWLYKRVLFWFYSFLHMSDDGLKVYVDKYNDGELDYTLCLALEAIEQMSG